jgi:hypothetical protein
MFPFQEGHRIDQAPLAQENPLDVIGHGHGAPRHVSDFPGLSGHAQQAARHGGKNPGAKEKQWIWSCFHDV